MTTLVPDIIIRKTAYIWHGGETCDWTSSRFQLVYLAGGMLSGGVRLPDGEWLYRNSGEMTESRMLLVPPGGSFLGEFDQLAREFAVFEFDCEGLRYDVEHRVFNWPLGEGSSQQLTPCLPLKAHEVLRLRPAVTMIHERFEHDPASPGLRLAAAMGVVGLLAWLLVLPDCPPSERGMSPAARLKALIDRKPGWTVPMTTMFKKIGRSPQTLRREFRREFGVTPMRYREQKRRHIAFSYIRATRLPLKVICERLGMKSPTHLSIYIRRVTGKTPRELRAEAQTGRRRASRPKA